MKRQDSRTFVRFSNQISSGVTDVGFVFIIDKHLKFLNGISKKFHSTQKQIRPSHWLQNHSQWLDWCWKVY